MEISSWWERNKKQSYFVFEAAVMYYCLDSGSMVSKNNGAAHKTSLIKQHFLTDAVLVSSANKELLFMA